VDLAWERRRVSDFFSKSYGWDQLAARSVWALGPTPSRGANALLDDTLPGDTDKARLGAVKDSLVQGFQWGCREGPLCDEPMRGVRFRLIGSEVSGEAIARGGGQVIPTARKLVYSSFLTAGPRLLEPVYAVEVLCPGEVGALVGDALAGRRGHVISDTPRPGTPWRVIRGYLPVMDSFGFETDLRVGSQGLAFPLQTFDHWSVVPGDPLDKSAVLRPLEPSPLHALARDFMVKTRRRKGLPEDVVPTRFFSSELLLELLRQEEEAAGM
jgi:U5 small nuclear ribonucleoprotein component